MLGTVLNIHLLAGGINQGKFSKGLESGGRRQLLFQGEREALAALNEPSLQYELSCAPSSTLLNNSYRAGLLNTIHRAHLMNTFH